MTYLEIKITAKIPFNKKVRIVDSPDEDEIKCLLIRGNFYMPELQMMKYDPDYKFSEESNLEKGVWSELPYDEFEELIDDKYIMQIDHKIKILKESPELT